MKKIISSFVFVFSLTVFAPLGIVFAQDFQESESYGVRTMSRPEDVTEEGRANGRQARVEAYKELAQTRLTTAQENRITGRCRSAQDSIERIQSTTDKVMANRQAAYLRVTTKLTELIAKLQVAEVDTTNLEAVVDRMLQLSSAKEAATLEFAVTLSDLSAMDCAADPQGFQAALFAARQQRASLFSQAQTVRGSIQEEVRPELEIIRDTLINPSADTGSELQEEPEIPQET